jgi:hypothetical protein
VGEGRSDERDKGQAELWDPLHMWFLNQAFDKELLRMRLERIIGSWKTKVDPSFPAVTGKVADPVDRSGVTTVLPDIVGKAAESRSQFEAYVIGGDYEPALSTQSFSG